MLLLSLEDTQKRLCNARATLVRVLTSGLRISCLLSAATASRTTIQKSLFAFTCLSNLSYSLAFSRQRSCNARASAHEWPANQLPAVCHRLSNYYSEIAIRFQMPFESLVSSRILSSTLVQRSCECSRVACESAACCLLLPPLELPFKNRYSLSDAFRISIRFSRATLVRVLTSGLRISAVCCYRLSLASAR